MPNPQQTGHARRQAQQQVGAVTGNLQKAAEADLARYNAQKAVLEATLTNLRSKLSDLESDNWMYEAPRYSHH